MYKVWLKSPYAFYLGMHWFHCSINCKAVANNGVSKASRWVITQTVAMTAVSSSNKTAETGSKKDGDMKIQKNFQIS